MENFKTYWLNYFRDNSIFLLDLEDDGIIEKITVRSPNIENKSRIELMMFIGEGDYQKMFAIRFYHPALKGLSKMNESDHFGFDGYKDNFKTNNVKQMTAMIDGFINYGCSEITHLYEKRIFKYEYIFYRANGEHKFTYKPNGDDLLAIISRFFNRSKIKKEWIKIEKWR